MCAKLSAKWPCLCFACRACFDLPDSVCAGVQSSLTSEMRNLSFAHVRDFHHRHFMDARHDFMIEHPQEFLDLVTGELRPDSCMCRNILSRIVIEIYLQLSSVVTVRKRRTTTLDVTASQ